MLPFMSVESDQVRSRYPILPEHEFHNIASMEPFTRGRVSYSDCIPTLNIVGSDLFMEIATLFWASSRFTL